MLSLHFSGLGIEGSRLVLLPRCVLWRWYGLRPLPKPHLLGAMP